MPNTSRTKAKSIVKPKPCLCPVRLRRLLQLSLEYFPPSLSGDYTETTIFQSIWSYNYESWQIPVFAPTMHERLEAQLQLRDWLRDKVSPTELAELMGQ